MVASSVFSSSIFRLPVALHALPGSICLLLAILDTMHSNPVFFRIPGLLILSFNLIRSSARSIRLSDFPFLFIDSYVRGIVLASRPSITLSFADLDSHWVWLTGISICMEASELEEVCW